MGRSVEASHLHLCFGRSIRLTEHVLRTFLEELLDPCGAVESFGEKFDRLVDAFVGLGATEADEASAGLAEGFAPETRDTELIVSAFEQIKRQAVRGDLQPVTDRLDVGENVEGPGGRDDSEALDLGQAGREALDLAAEAAHVFVAGG